MGSWKLETDVDPDGLPRFLRDLADELESGVSGSGAGELAGLPKPSRSDELAGLRKLVLVATALGGGDGFALRLKAKRGHEVRVPTGQPPQRGGTPGRRTTPRACARSTASSRRPCRRTTRLCARPPRPGSCPVRTRWSRFWP